MVEVKITAKQIEWEVFESPTQEGYREFAGCHGFHITEDPAEIEDGKFYAAWGEGDGERFQSLADAKSWCQNAIDDHIRENVLISLVVPGMQLSTGRQEA